MKPVFAVAVPALFMPRPAFLYMFAPHLGVVPLCMAPDILDTPRSPAYPPVPKGRPVAVLPLQFAAISASVQSPPDPLSCTSSWGI
jgi:hypothetical protein